MSEERAHRRFSPSQSERFINCPGSTNLLARVSPSPPSRYAVEGTKAHDILAFALKNYIVNAKLAHTVHPTLKEEVLDTGDNQFYWSIQQALDYIYNLVFKTGNAYYAYQVEQFVSVPSDNAPDEASGYCDFYFYNVHSGTLHVVDYKHGAGVAKDVINNSQILQYGAGVVFGEDIRVDEVVLVIIQPRAYHPDGIIRECVVTPLELFDYVQRLDAAIAENLKLDAPLKIGEWCRFCDARSVCPAQDALARTAVNKTFTQITDIKPPAIPGARTLDVERLAYIRRVAPDIRAFLNDVEDHCLALAMRGQKIPGAKLAQTQARRKWQGSTGEVAAKLAALIEGDPLDMLETKLISVTDAEKLVVEAFKRRSGNKRQAAEDAKQAMAFLTVKESSGRLKLVNEEDEVPEVTIIDQFAQLTENLGAKT